MGRAAGLPRTRAVRPVLEAGGALPDRRDERRPTVYAALAQHPVDADICSLRLAMVGASPLPAAVRDGFQAHTGVPCSKATG